MSDTMQGMFNQLEASGWAGIDVDPDRLGADVQAMMAEAVEEAMPVARLFASDEGQRVLLWLMKKTILKPPSPEEVVAKTAEEFAIIKARRDGQNGVIFMILSALQVASGEQATTGEG